MRIVEKHYVFHHVSKIYHTEIDYKLHALTFREQGLETLVIQPNDGNENE